MAHVLARLNGVKVEDLKQALQADAARHAEEGLFVEHVWQNTDDPQEVLFLFRTADLGHTRQFIENVHAQAREQDAQAKLPYMTFLEEK
jgi:hypothetical protein